MMGPFVIGSRVRLTEKARKVGIRLKKKVTTGILVGVKSPLGLIVQPDGYKTKMSFHMDFWEPVCGPRRVQRKRTQGWKMPSNTIYVGRPTKFGNPFLVNEYCSHKLAVENFSTCFKLNGFISDEKGRLVTILDIKQELHGKNLACWCPLDQPCHADVLLELSNG